MLFHTLDKVFRPLNRQDAKKRKEVLFAKEAGRRGLFMAHLTDHAWVDCLFHQHDNYPPAASSGLAKNNFVRHTPLPTEDWRLQMTLVPQ